MSNRQSRRHPPRPTAAPLPLPPVRQLEGWTLDQLAEASGVPRTQALRVLVPEIAAGRVAEIRTGGRTLYARVGGGHIAEVRR